MLSRHDDDDWVLGADNVAISLDQQISVLDNADNDNA